MRALLVATILMGGCVDGGVDCGPMPDVPGWSVAIYKGYPGHSDEATMPAEQWYAHKAWREAVTAWGHCITGE